MNGGSAVKMIPLYKEPKNSPFVTNEQKTIYNDRINELPAQTSTVPQFGQIATQQKPVYNNAGPNINNNSKGNQPMINLQVYQPPKPPAQNKPMDFSTIMPIAMPTPFFPPQFNYNYSMGQNPAQSQMTWPINVIKQYTINTTGPTGDHAVLNRIYEDALPTKQFVGTSNTISERMTMHDYIRAIMYNNGDGTDINLDGTDNDSLISHLRFMDLNPYNTYKFSKNPYMGLPTNMLMYRSCYPIRHDPLSGGATCARNSVGVNIRIYKMTEGEYMVNKQNIKNYLDYETYREVAYYEFVKGQIIKNNVCPNFVTMYGYSISTNSKIDFDKINLIKGAKVINEPQYLAQIPSIPSNNVAPSNTGVMRNATYQPGVNMPTLPNSIRNINQTDQTNQTNQTNQNELYRIHTELVRRQQGRNYKPIDLNVLDRNKHQMNSQTGGQVTLLEKNINAFSGKALVILTESPHYNLFGWASKTYQMEGNIARMINTGFHTDSVWASVLFQMMAAFHVMQINKFYFTGFSLEDNVFIKDLSLTNNVTAYWKYKINGLDYFVPNYGYMVMFDTSFKDIGTNSNTILQTKNRKHKIYSNVIKSDDEPDYDDNQISKNVFAAFSKAFSTNSYDQTFINNGGCPPPPNTKSFLDKVFNKSSTDQIGLIGPYISEFMRHYLNNRTGTYLKEQELSNIRKDGNTNYKKGDLVVFEEGNDVYKFVIFIKETNNGKAHILTKVDPTHKDITDANVPLTSLFAYSKMEPIVQTFKANEANLNEEDLLETYVIG
jgi:hypothetical protein